MEELIYVLTEARRLVWKHRLYFLLPIASAAALLAFLAYRLGPAAVTFFRYSDR